MFKHHINRLKGITDTLLQTHNFDALLIFSGRPKYHFLDDYTASFNANPHFQHWAPFAGDPAESWLFYTPGEKPQLYLYSPDDFWHITPEEPSRVWCNEIDVVLFTDKDELPFLSRLKGKIALISEPEVELSEVLVERNPETLLAGLHYHRAVKSEWEQNCIREANQYAVKGHLAAQRTFFAQQTEFEIHQSYLLAAEHLEAELPYGNIIALNEHAAVLHYQYKDKQQPSSHNTLLVDGGAAVHGYAADITRTVAQGNAVFKELLSRMDAAHLALLNKVKPGVSFVDLHIDMHRSILHIFSDLGLLQGVDQLSPSEQTQISAIFFPHGLGHFLGLQVHDIGGWQHDESGSLQSPPDAHPFLRLTRTLEEGQVITVEPGVYFIPSLLEKLKTTQLSTHVNWQEIDRLIPWGGIRIEDNVCVTATGHTNYTRDAFAKLDV